MLGIWEVLVVTDQYVVKLKIIIGVSSLVDHSERVKELNTDLKNGLLSEWLISLEKVVFHGVSKLLLDQIGPDLALDFRVGILLFLEIFVVFIKLLVINNHFTLRVGAGIEWVFSSLFLDITDDIFERSIFTVVHFVILSKFHDYWPWNTLSCLLQIIGLEDLAKSAFSQ